MDPEGNGGAPENGSSDPERGSDAGRTGADLDAEAVGDESVGTSATLAPDVPGRGKLTDQQADDVETVAKGGAVQIAGQLSQRGLAQVFTAVATRILDTAGYGLYRQVAQVLGIASQLGLAGFNYAAMRFVARARAGEQPGGVRGAARFSLVASAVGAAVIVVALLVLAEPFAEAFADPGTDIDALADLFRLGVPYVPLFGFMQVLRYSTQGYKTMVPSVISGNIIQPFARFLLAMAAFAIGLGVAGAVGSLALSMGVGALAAAFYYRRMLTAEERAAIPKIERGAMIRFALPQGGASVLGVQTLGLGIIILGLYRGDFQVGVLAIALALQGPGTVFLGGIVNIWAPVVSDLYDRNEIDRLDALYKTITRWVATFSFPVFALIILESDLLAAVLAPPRGAAAAAPVAAILAVGNFFYTGTGPTGYVISMSGRPGLNLINSAVGVALYVGIGLLVVEEHGAIGIAVADALVTALINSVRVVQARRIVGVQPFGRSFLKPVAATLGGAVALLAWRLVPGESVLVQIAGIAVAAAVYLLLLRTMGIDPEERHVWERIVKRVRRNRPKR